MQDTRGSAMVMSFIVLPNLPFFDQVGCYALGYVIIRFFGVFLNIFIGV